MISLVIVKGMKRYIAILFFVGILIGFGICQSYFLWTEQSKSWHLAKAHAKELAYSYLVDSYNPTLGLCYEYPNSDVYWVSHDNVLASYVLQNWNREIADNITETVKKIAEDFNLTRSQIGIPLDCRAEILLGYDVNVFFNKTELLTLNSSYYGSVLKTERATNEILKDFENYADLLCFASLLSGEIRTTQEQITIMKKLKQCGMVMDLQMTLLTRTNSMQHTS